MTDHLPWMSAASKLGFLISFGIGLFVWLALRQAPDRTADMSVEQLLARIIDDSRRLGEKMPAQDPRNGYATLRLGLGQNLCSLAYWLDGADLPEHQGAACNTLWLWWPPVAEGCPSCER